MNCIDLISFVKAFPSRKLSGVTVYGRIVKIVDKPFTISDVVPIEEGGIWVEVECVAIKLNNYYDYLKKFGNYTNDLVIVKGSLVSYISEPETTQTWVTLTGTLASSREDEAFFSLLKWRDIADSDNNFNNDEKPRKVWAIKLLYADRLDLIKLNEELEKTGKPKDEYGVIYNSYIANKAMLPEEMESMRYFSAIPFDNRNFVQGKVETSNNCTPVHVDFSEDNPDSKCRQKVRRESKIVSKLQDKINASKIARDEFVRSVFSKYKEPNFEIIGRVCDGINKNFKSRMQSGQTGRSLLKNYMLEYETFYKAEYMGTIAGDFILNSFPDITDYLKGKQETVMLTDSALTFFNIAFANRDTFFAGILAKITGVEFDALIDCATNLYLDGISFSAMCADNPYLLQIITNLSFSDIETIAVALGVHEKDAISEYKCMALLNDYMMSNSVADTLFKTTDLVRAKIGLKLTEVKYKRNNENGSILTRKQQEMYDSFLGNNNTRYKNLQSMRKLDAYYYFLPLTSYQISDAIILYKKSGLGVEIGDYLTPTVYADKELYVYTMLHTIASTENTLYDKKLVNEYIDEFEEEKGFKLEEKQRDAVHLIKYNGGIITGGAGSGKTTTSECMVYVLEKLGFKYMKFAAPTGKAAKRMQEVIGKEAKTLHSLFKLGRTEDDILHKEPEQASTADTIYMFDECSMITIDLMYSVLKRVNKYNNKVYLFGDHNQLPAIGKGQVLKNMLGFMPTVYLNVTKRAEEGSNITYASKLINEHSNKDNWEKLPNDKDFFLVNSSSDEIPNTISLLTKWFLNDITPEECMKLDEKMRNIPDNSGFTADDVQIVTPFSKESYKWGAIKLNEVLQPIFNKTSGYRNTLFYQPFKDKKYKFKKGDRILHGVKNMYSMQWYNYDPRSKELQKIYGFGINNGEVGELVDFVKADDIEILEEDEMLPLNFEYPKRMRDDSTYTGADKWFVIVKYYDYLSNRDFYIAYRAKETIFDNNEGISLTGEDFGFLSLFYAGTVHKMQGSECKICIMALGNVNFKGFITRNMLYTGVTRGKKCVIVVGSVDNSSNSMLSNARRDVGNKNVLTVGKLLNET